MRTRLYQESTLKINPSTLGLLECLRATLSQIGDSSDEVHSSIHYVYSFHAP
jgi:hypothetical protein